MKKETQHIEYFEGKKEEEIRQNTVTEYRKFYKNTKNLTKEYQPRNLNNK